MSESTPMQPPTDHEPVAHQRPTERRPQAYLIAHADRERGPIVITLAVPDGAILSGPISAMRARQVAAQLMHLADQCDAT